MIQCNVLNVKLSDSQPNKLKSRIRNGISLTLKLSSNVTADSNDESNFSHKLLSTNSHVLRLWKAFTGNSLANIKF